MFTVAGVREGYAVGLFGIKLVAHGTFVAIFDQSVLR